MSDLQNNHKSSAVKPSARDRLIAKIQNHPTIDPRLPEDMFSPQLDLIMKASAVDFISLCQDLGIALPTFTAKRFGDIEMHWRGDQGEHADVAFDQSQLISFSATSPNGKSFFQAELFKRFNRDKFLEILGHDTFAFVKALKVKKPAQVKSPQAKRTSRAEGAL